MSQLIYKFILEMQEIQNIQMPKGAKLLSAQFQGDDLCLWALCDPNQPHMHRKIRLEGTGHEIQCLSDKEMEFIATVQDGRFVWHIFEEY